MNKRPLIRAALLLAVALAFLAAGCTTTSSVEPDGSGGWQVNTAVHVHGSRTVLPNNAVPPPPPD